jgi:hypothetical protein
MPDVLSLSGVMRGFSLDADFGFSSAFYGCSFRTKQKTPISICSEQRGLWITMDHPKSSFPDGLKKGTCFVDTTASCLHITTLRVNKK